MEKLLERSCHITWSNESEKQQIVNFLENLGFELNNYEIHNRKFILTYPSKHFSFHNHNGGYAKLNINEIIPQEPNYEIY